MTGARWPLGPGAALALAGSACADPPRPRGVIVVSIDTLRADATSPWGAPPEQTPHLSRIAAGGVRFDRVWAQANETLPSHASLFTSRMPSQLGPVTDELTIPDGTPTLAGALASAGYRTAALVAGGHLARVFGLDDGFQTWVEGQPWGSLQETVPMALRWLEQAPADQPFFLFIHGYDCHAPYVKPFAFGRLGSPGYSGPLLPYAYDPHTYSRLYGRAFFPDFPLEVHPTARGTPMLRRVEHEELPRWATRDDVRRIGLNDEDLGFVRGLYQTSATYADLWLGVLDEGLTRMGLDQTTVLVVLSDHGEGFGEHSFFGHRTVLQDATLQVPLVVRRPPPAATGVVVHDVVRLLDVAPTLLELEGVPVPAGMRGRSLAPCLDGGSCGPAKVAVSEAVFGEISATDGTLRLSLEGVRPGDPAAPGLLRSPSAGSARLWDASGPPGTERARPIAAVDRGLLLRLGEAAAAELEGP